MNTDPHPVQRSFILIQDDPVISMDLIGLLETSFPNCVTHLFDHLDAAMVSFSKVIDTASILVSSNFVTTTAMQTLDDLVACGAQVVVIGASDAAGVATVVNTPFSTKMVLDAL